MLDVGSIKPSNSAWSNVVILVRKKDGGLRFCIDFRHLNSHTKKDAFPLPQIHDTISALKGSKYYITVDLLSGFWQTPMAAESKQYTAFTVCMLGFYECECMLFGLCNAPATFQHLMQNCLGELNYTTCLVYLDDVVVYSSMQEEQLDQLREVLEWFRLNSLKLKTSKCSFFQQEIKYLGHHVSAQGIWPSHDNLRVIVECPEPTTYILIRGFIGIVGHYC